MALAVNDIIQMTDVQTYLGQQVLNVYFYQVTELDPDATLEDFAQAFETHVVTPMLTGQMTSLTHQTLIVKNLTDGIGIWEEPQARTGTFASNDGQASFYAWGFRLIRTDGRTRHGGKRIGGVPEDLVANNGPVAGATSVLTGMATAFGTPVEVEGTVNDFVLIPVIVGRHKQGTPDAGQLDLSVINPISSAQFVRVTTQTTRRAGRGA